MKPKLNNHKQLTSGYTAVAGCFWFIDSERNNIMGF